MSHTVSHSMGLEGSYRDPERGSGRKGHLQERDHWGGVLPYDVNSAFWPEGFEFWSLDVNGGDEWKVEDLSRDQRKEFPNDQVKKYFVTSY